MHSGFDAPAFWPPAWMPDAFVAPQGIDTLRWASAGYGSARTDSPASTIYYPRLLGDIEISQSSVDAIGIGGRLPVGISTIGLADADSALSDLHRYGVADGRALRIIAVPVEEPRASDVGTPLAGRALSLELDFGGGSYVIVRTDPVVAFTGLTRAVERNGDRTGTLIAVDTIEQLAVPLQPTKYAGTGDVEGGEELKGQPKPALLGRCYNVTPVFLGDIDLGAGALPTYQVSWRGILSVDAVRIRGVEQALVSSGTPTVGQARPFEALGMFQLGSTPDGAVTADVRGDAVGGYVSSTAGVLRRLVDALGPGVGALATDSVAFAFAEVDLPGEIGWYSGVQEVTAADAATEIVQACGGVLCGGRSGQLRLFDPLADDGSDQFHIQAGWILDCAPVPLPAALRPLPVATGVRWRRNWTPLSDVAGSITGADRERLRNPSSGPERVNSVVLTQRIGAQRDYLLSGLYWDQADAAARAQKWASWLEAGPRLFRVTTDRYLGQIECGHIGRVDYDLWEMGGGVRGVVVGWQEQLAARRLTLTIATLPGA